jgi:hypothetical protein
MKKIIDIVMFTLALNFLALIGGAVYLHQTGHLDKARAHAVKEILFPPPATQPTTQPVATDPTTQPSLRLDELLAKAAGRPAGDQVEFLQRAFDSRAAELDSRQRQLQNMQTMIDRATADLTEQRQAVAAEKAALEQREQESARLASDQGFQDSLALYSGLPSTQVKTIFMSLSDDVVVRYLRAMPPRTATKIMKEFKSPPESDRLKKWMEQMRQATADAGATTAPTADAPEAPSGAAASAAGK